MPLDSLEAGNHHEAQHGEKEDNRVQQKTIGSGRTHGMCHIYEGAQDSLREFVGLWIRHYEKDEGGYEGIFGLQQYVQHLLYRELFLRRRKSTFYLLYFILNL